MGVGSPSDEPAWLRSRLLPGDPYAGFPVHEWAPDLQGWGARHPLFGELIGVLEPSIIVEVGTWKGAPAIGNVLHTGMDDMILPLPQTSDNAAQILGQLDVRPNLVYLDGAYIGPAAEGDQAG